MYPDLMPPALHRPALYNLTAIFQGRTKCREMSRGSLPSSTTNGALALEAERLRAGHDFRGQGRLHTCDVGLLLLNCLAHELALLRGRAAKHKNTRHWLVQTVCQVKAWVAHACENTLHIQHSTPVALTWQPRWLADDEKSICASEHLRQLSSHAALMDVSQVLHMQATMHCLLARGKSEEAALCSSMAGKLCGRHGLAVTVQASVEAITIGATRRCCAGHFQLYAASLAGLAPPGLIVQLALRIAHKTSHG
mmetsp:Transcript_101157/g.294560  ORF Transcript_101157/g.294560 Transcript_101157/m.294560 type:complete len:252 (+) Transcript_101157:314-1069(+)